MGGIGGLHGRRRVLHCPPEVFDNAVHVFHGNFMLDPTEPNFPLIGVAMTQPVSKVQNCQPFDVLKLPLWRLSPRCIPHTRHFVVHRCPVSHRNH